MDDSISRQAAIDALDKIFPTYPMKNDFAQGLTCGAALATEYIKQLPSAQPNVPDTNVGGIISRQAVYEILERYNSTADPDAIRMDVEDLPSAQERKKGKWIELDGTTIRSACGLSLEDWIQAAFYNFCPNCGADMRQIEFRT